VRSRRLKQGAQEAAADTTVTVDGKTQRAGGRRHGRSRLVQLIKK
jgi:hypothetical protein